MTPEKKLFHSSFWFLSCILRPSHFNGPWFLPQFWELVIVELGFTKKSRRLRPTPSPSLACENVKITVKINVKINVKIYVNINMKFIVENKMSKINIIVLYLDIHPGVCVPPASVLWDHCRCNRDPAPQPLDRAFYNRYSYTAGDTCYEIRQYYESFIFVLSENTADRFGVVMNLFS